MAARLLETENIIGARLKSFIDSGKIMSDAAE